MDSSMKMILSLSLPQDAPIFYFYFFESRETPECDGQVIYLHESNSFWSYEYGKRLMASEEEDSRRAAIRVLLCGGIAGIITWASVFPLDVIKTRLQAQTITDSRQPLVTHPESQQLLQSSNRRMPSSFQLAKEAYRVEGLKVFYRGLGVCSLRAFIVNAVQVSASLLETIADPGRLSLTIQFKVGDI